MAVHVYSCATVGIIAAPFRFACIWTLQLGRREGRSVTNLGIAVNPVNGRYRMATARAADRCELPVCRDARARGGDRVLSRGALDVEVTLDPFSSRRAQRKSRCSWQRGSSARPGTESDHLIHLTEGVVAEEAWGERRGSGRAGSRRPARRRPVGRAGARGGVRIQLASDARVIVELEADPAPFRLGPSGRAPRRARDRPWGAPRRALRPGRAADPARRRPPLHGPRLPAGDARRGRHPAG